MNKVFILKKRLRKKLRVGEFYEPFISLTGSFNKELSEVEINMYIDNMIFFVDSFNIMLSGFNTPTEVDWIIHGGKFWSERLTEDQIQAFLMKWYKNVYVNGTHIITIHRSEKNKEVLTFSGWC